MRRSVHDQTSQPCVQDRSNAAWKEKMGWGLVRRLLVLSKVSILLLGVNLVNTCIIMILNTKLYQNQCDCAELYKRIHECYSKYTDLKVPHHTWKGYSGTRGSKSKLHNCVNVRFLVRGILLCTHTHTLERCNEEGNAKGTKRRKRSGERNKWLS